MSSDPFKKQPQQFKSAFQSGPTPPLTGSFPATSITPSVSPPPRRQEFRSLQPTPEGNEGTESPAELNLLPRSTYQAPARPTPAATIMQPSVSVAQPITHYSLFDPATNAHLLAASAPLMSPEVLTQQCNDIIADLKAGNIVQVLVVWRWKQRASASLPPFEASRGTAKLIGDTLNVYYPVGYGNSKEVENQTVPLPFTTMDPSSVVEYSHVAYETRGALRTAPAPSNHQVKPRQVQSAVRVETDDEGDEEQVQPRQRRMEPLLRSGSFEVHDGQSMAIYIAELVTSGTASQLIVQSFMAEVDRQCNRGQLRFKTATVDAVQQMLSDCILTILNDRNPFENERSVVSLLSAVSAYRVAVASAINGAKNVDRAVNRAAVNIPRNDLLGRAIANCRGRGGLGRGGRGRGFCSYCKKTGHTVDSCWQKQGQGNVSRGEAGKSTRQ